MARKLKKISIEEVTLCGSAATKKKFYIKKENRTMEKFIELIKRFFGKDIEEEDIEKAKNLPEEDAQELQEALTAIDGYEDEVDPEFFEAVQTIAKHAITKEKKEEPAEIDFVEELQDVEKAGAKLSKATIAQLKKIQEIINGMITTKEASVKKDLKENLPESVVAQLEELKKYKEKEQRDLKKKEKDDLMADFQEKLDEVKEEYEEKFKELKKKLKTRKSIVGQEGDDDLEEEETGGGGKNEDEPKWPSLIPSEEN